MKGRLRVVVVMVVVLVVVVVEVVVEESEAAAASNIVYVCMQADTAVEAMDGLTRSLPGAVVCISVGVIKASGLQVCIYKIVDC